MKLAQKSIIKKQFENAIESNPTTIILMRSIKTKIGRDSYSIEDVKIAKFDCVLDFSKSKLDYLKRNAGDFGKINRVKDLIMSTMYNENFEIKSKDFFIYNDVKHVILYPNKIYDLFWECSVEVYLDD